MPRRCLLCLISICLISCGVAEPTPIQQSAQNPITQTTLLPANWTHHATWDKATMSFFEPSGIAIDSQGNVYVADTGHGFVHVFQNNGTFIASWGGEGTKPGQFGGNYNGPRGIAIDSQDNVYVVDSGNARIQKFSRDGTLLLTWGKLGERVGEFSSDRMLGPMGIAIDSQNNIYVADTFNNRIQKFSSDGAFITEWNTTHDREYSAPTWLAVVGDTIYVTDGLQDTIQAYKLNGEFIKQWNAQDLKISKVSGIAVNAAQQIFIAGEGTIHQFNPDGSIQTIIDDTENIEYPEGIAFDRAGRLFVVDKNQFDVDVYIPQVNLAFEPTQVVPLSIQPLPTPNIAPASKTLNPSTINQVINVATLGNGIVGETTISPDGKYIAVATSTQIMLYDATLKLQHSLATGEVLFVKFSPDSQVLAVAMHSGNVLLIEAGTGTIKHTLSSNNSFSYFGGTLEFSPDGTLLGVAKDKIIYVWNVADGRLVHTLVGHSNIVDALRFSRDNTTLISIDGGMAGVERSDPMEARIWSLADEKATVFTSEIYEHVGQISLLDEQNFVIREVYGRVMHGNFASNTITITKTLAKDTGIIAISADTSLLAIGHENGTIDLVQLNDGKTIQTLSGAPSGARSIAFSGDNNQVVASFSDGVRLWQRNNSTVAYETGGFSDSIQCAALSPDGTLIVVGTYSGKVMLWDLASQTMRWSVQAHSWSVNKVAFAPDGKTVASGGEFMVDIENFSSEALQVRSVADGSLVRAIIGIGHNVDGLSYTPDAQMLLTSSSDTVQIWRIADGTMIKTLAENENFSNFQFTADGQMLIGGIEFSRGVVARVWQITSGNIIRDFSTTDEALFEAMTLAPDNKTVVTSGDENIYVWNVADGGQKHTFKAKDRVSHMDISPDNSLLVVGCNDGHLEFWDLATGKQLYSVQAHTSYIEGVFFSPDGASLVVAANEGTITRWGLK